MLEKHIFLIGFMGAGKTAVSKALAGKTGERLVDVDEELVEKAGMTISDIFERYGEDYFRKLETEALKRICEAGGCIVSCGGGLPLREENRKLMREHGDVVWLTAEPKTIYKRVKNSNKRPILNGNMNVEFISELMEKRQPHYKEAANIIVKTDNKSIEELCSEILSLK